MINLYPLPFKGLIVHRIDSSLILSCCILLIGSIDSNIFNSFRFAINKLSASLYANVRKAVLRKKSFQVAFRRVVRKIADFDVVHMDLVVRLTL